MAMEHSRRATTTSCICAAFFVTIVRFLWFDFRKKDKIHWARPNFQDKIVPFTRCEDNIHDERSKSMVCYIGDTRVRLPALKDETSHPRTRMLLSSWSLLGVWQYGPATTGTLHPFQMLAKSSNAVATSSLHHVSDWALKPAGLFRV